MLVYKRVLLILYALSLAGMLCWTPVYATGALSKSHPELEATGLSASISNDQCFGRIGATPVEAHEIDDARRRLMPFKKSLMGTLKQGLQDGSLSALTRCNLQAPAISASHKGKSVQLGRTSNRLRNPDNVGPHWTQDILERYLQAPGSAEAVAMRLPDGTLAYAEPIRIMPLCLQCHGENLADPVRQALDELYPQDQAINYRAGDIRGLFWMEIQEPSGTD